mgnify:CR=1 FL=1
MEIEIPKEIDSNMENVSKEIGLSKEEIVARALVLYLANLKDYLFLKEEMSDWEETGIEDTAKWNEENLKDG